MQLEDLKIFIAIAEEGSASAAARKMGMTQPGVSQHLRKLEEAVTAPLFERLKKRLVLNEHGHALLEKARRILNEVEEMKGIASRPIDAEGILRLGLTDASTQTIIPPKLKEYREKHPKVHLEIIVSDSDKIEEGILKGRYDVGIISGGSEPHRLLEEHIIGEDRMDCLVSNKHTLAQFKVVELAELAKHPLFVYPRGSRTRQILESAFRDQGIVPSELIDVTYNSAAIRLAEAGLGVAILSRFFIQNELVQNRCHHMRIKGDPLKRTICVVRKKDERLSEAAYHFYRLLQPKR